MRYKEYQKISNQIMELYVEMDNKNDRFSKRFNIGCVSSCNGSCCGNVDVEVSPVDLIPLSIELIEKNLAMDVLKTLEDKKNTSCMFFQNGKCTVYNKRAVLCRLFGYSRVTNKSNNPILSVCSKINEEYTHPIAKVNAQEAVNLPEYAAKVKNLIPEWQNQTLPFNQALEYALNRIYHSYLYSDLD